MRRSPFPTLLCSLAMATISCLTGSASARDLAAELTDVLIDVPSDALPSGILYDRVVPLSHIGRFDGRAESPPAGASSRGACGP